MKTGPSLLFIVLAMQLLRCGWTPLAGGGGTEVGDEATIIGQVVDTAGNPASGMKVRMRTVDYLSTIPEKAFTRMAVLKFDGLTNDDGTFTIDSVDIGEYFIEVTDDESLSVLFQVEMTSTANRINLETKTLKKNAVVRGSLSLSTGVSSAHVRVYGLERLLEVKDAASSFSVALPAGDFTLRFSTGDSNVVPVEIDTLSVSAAEVKDLDVIIVKDTADPYYGWKRFSRLVINTSSTGADVTEDIVNFPLLVRLDSANFDFTRAQSDGADLRFSKSDGITPLPYEIERWDSVGGLAEIWVKLDTIYGNNNSQFVYMYTGNDVAIAQTSGSDVFDTAAGFTGVWHLDENPAAGGNIILDRTGNNNHGTPVGGMSAGDVVEGMVGKALNFNGSDAYVTFGDIDALDGLSKLTAAAWVRVTTLKEYVPIISKRSDNNNGWFFMEEGNANNFGQGSDDFLIGTRNNISGSTQDGRTTGDVLSAGTWEYCVMVYDGTQATREARLKFYIDGSELALSYADSIPASLPLTDAPLQLAKNAFETNYYHGVIDEVVIANDARSAAWIKLCYMNQNIQTRIIDHSQQ